MSKTFTITNIADPAADIQKEMEDRRISEYRLYTMGRVCGNRSTLHRWISGAVPLKVKDMIKIVHTLGYDEIVIKIRR